MSWSRGQTDSISFAGEKVKRVIEHSGMEPSEAGHSADNKMLHRGMPSPGCRQPSDCGEHSLFEGRDGQIRRGSVAPEGSS